MPIPLANEWFEYREQYFGGSNLEIPEGWRRYESQEPLPAKQPFYYKHELLPDTEFLYPVPIVDDDQVPETIAWGQLLSCRTQKARFWSESVLEREELFNILGHTKHVSAWFELQFMPVPLRDHTGADAGFLKLHNRSHLCTQGAQGSYELVAISQGYAFGPTGRGKPSPTPMEPYDFYNVLWVEWIDGIAFGKGLGRVFKDVWDRQEREDVHLILG
jgi:hypothetical protein